MASDGKRRGCGCGCIPLLFGVLLIFVALVVAWPFAVQNGILEVLGLRKSAEQLLSGTPDREAAGALREELEQGGMNTAGMQLAVFPFRGRDDSLAIVVLDASQGFTFSDLGSDDVIIETFRRVATGPVARRHSVSRVAIHYIDEEGEPQLSVTAPTDAIRRFEEGELSREDLMEAIESEFELADLFGEVMFE